MYEELIVAAEGTPRDLAAVRVAAGIARQCGVPWRLVSVVSTAAEVELRDVALAAALRDAGVDVPRIEVLVDTYVAGRLAILAGQRADALLCLATHARPPIGELVLGSVAEAVVRAADVPLLLVGPQQASGWAGRIQTVVVCLDTSALSEAVLPAAVRLARQAGARLMLVEVLSPDRARATSGSDVAGESSYLHNVAAALRRDHGAEATWDVLHGDDAGEAIAAYAAGLDGAVIAMTTHGRSGLRQVVVGSVSHTVLRRAACPVLLQRPTKA